MNQIKPLDQVVSIGANAHNQTVKVVNKFGSRDSILYKLKEFSSSVPDFRRTGKGNIRHRLDDIIMLMILARASKCVGRTEMIEFGKHNLKKFRQLGMLKNGVPSEATLFRAEHGIDELALADRMQEFAELFHRRLYKAEGAKEIICVDGKAERGTVLDNGRNPDIVSAYSYNTAITLATEACREKSNEIKAVPRLVDKIDISGKIVTADAMSMQKCIIDRIRENGGDFLIELKANQPSLRYGVEDRLKGHAPVYSYTEGPELGQIQLLPFAGLNLTAHILCQSKYEGVTSDWFKSDNGDSAANRFQLCAQLGVKAVYNRYFLEFAYHPSLTNLADRTSLNLINVSFGFMF